MTNRKSIPEATRIEVLTQAGYRCAVPTCHGILALDIHHLIHVSMDGPNTTENLLPLCPTCHALYHRGYIHQSSLAKWKERLVRLEGNNQIATGVTQKEAEIAEPPANIPTFRLKNWHDLALTDEEVNHLILDVRFRMQNQELPLFKVEHESLQLLTYDFNALINKESLNAADKEERNRLKKWIDKLSRDIARIELALTIMFADKTFNECFPDIETANYINSIRNLLALYSVQNMANFIKFDIWRKEPSWQTAIYLSEDEVTELCKRYNIATIDSAQAFHFMGSYLLDMPRWVILERFLSRIAYDISVMEEQKREHIYTPDFLDVFKWQMGLG